MAPLQEFERSNAREWDEGSVISTASSTHCLGTPNNGVGRGQTPITTSVSTIRGAPDQVAYVAQNHNDRENLCTGSLNHRNGAERGQAPPTASAETSNVSIKSATQNQASSSHPRNSGVISAHSITGAQYSPSNGNIIASNGYNSSQSQSLQQQGHVYISSHERQSYRAPSISHSSKGSKKTSWADISPLQRAREAKQKNERELKEAENESYRRRAESNDAFPVTGYYLWPRDSGDPMSLLDPSKNELDNLKTTCKVHIDWEENIYCLKINGYGRDAKQRVADAIRGIGLAYRNAKAEVISATPLYIIIPPSASSVRSIVQPRKSEKRQNFTGYVVTSIEIIGQGLSASQKLEWESRRRQKTESNFAAFRTHLIKRTRGLSNMRGWMRMRVQLGHINLSQYQDDFANSKYSFEKFAEMMALPRVAAGGTFDRKMDATIAMNLIQRIEGDEQHYCPVNPKLQNLKDVKLDPKHTEVVFVTTSGSGSKSLRLEAEIERINSGSRRYQIGRTRLFHDNRRNKRVEVTTVDIESKFDWNLEIITDGEIKDRGSSLMLYIATSLNPKSTERTDLLGLPYPGISMGAPKEFTVQRVAMRSVFQYMWLKTSNIVEVAIYREWVGHDTRPEPLVQASVSIFNMDWDVEMESIEHKPHGQRNWDEQLHNFFGSETVGRNDTGLPGLMANIRELQGLLSGAAEPTETPGPTTVGGTST